MRDNSLRHKEYLQLLKQETELIKRSELIDFSELNSVYIGGGTPSCLTTDELSELVCWIKKNVNTKTCNHWSIELNPDDITSNYAKNLIDLGFTRVSLGIQSFQDDLLAKLGRTHYRYQSEQSIEIIKKVGFKDFNIDLIFGFPNHDLFKIRQDIKRTLSYSPSHISAYSLTIEPKTRMDRLPDWKKWIENNDGLISNMYEMIVKELFAAGFDQYEVSNFARKGFRSYQNLVYWHREDYLGLGTGAHSLISGKRWGNVKRLTDYRNILKEDLQPISFSEELTPAMSRDESIMLGLRLSQGIDTEALKQQFVFEATEEWDQKVKLYCNHGFMQAEKSNLKLTTKGLLVADELTAALCSCLF